MEDEENTPGTGKVEEKEEIAEEKREGRDVEEIG